MHALSKTDIANLLLSKFDDTRLVDSDGDLFFFAGTEEKFPFATVVVKDTDFDNLSNLNRADVFRLNIGLCKESFQRLFPHGLEPEVDFNYSKLDTLMPHPAYGRMYWVCVLNPSWDRLNELTSLLIEAHNLQLSRTARPQASNSKAVD